MSDASMNCADCRGPIADPNRPCPPCGSTRRNATVIAASAQLRIRTGLPGWVKKWILPPFASWSDRAAWGSERVRPDLDPKRGQRLVRFRDEYDKERNRRFEHVETTPPARSSGTGRAAGGATRRATNPPLQG